MQKQKNRKIAGKKAQENTTAIKIVLVLLCLVIGLALYNLFAKSVTETFFNRDYCRNSAMAHSLKVPVMQSEGLWPLDCDTFDMKFYNDKIVMRNINDGKKLTLKPLNSKKYIREEDIYHYLAEQWALCWYQFHQGNADVFKDRKIDLVKTLCFKCNIISFDNEIQSRIKKTPEGAFLEYLKTHNPVSVPNSGVSYYDYLLNPGDQLELDDSQLKYEIDTTKDYFIVYSKRDVSTVGEFLGVGFKLITTKTWEKSQDYFTSGIVMAEGSDRVCKEWLS